MNCPHCGKQLSQKEDWMKHSKRCRDEVAIRIAIEVTAEYFDMALSEERIMKLTQSIRAKL